MKFTLSVLLVACVFITVQGVYLLNPDSCEHNGVELNDGDIAEGAANDGCTVCVCSKYEGRGAISCDVSPCGHGIGK